MSVGLYARVTVGGKRKYCRPVFTGNKKLKAGYALVNGIPESHPEAVFALRYTERGKRQWLEVGPDPNQAIAAKPFGTKMGTGQIFLHPL